MRRLESTATTNRPALRGEGGFRVLVIYAPPESSALHASYALGNVEVTIGREDHGAGSIVLEDRELSRRHAQLRRVPDGVEYEISDDGSRNGTFVNGRRITRAVLGDADVVRVGSHSLLIEFLTLEDCERLLAPRLPGSALRGHSLALLRLEAMIERFAVAPDPVLLLGESGSGKELVAAEIHRLSGRSGPFVPVNCAAIPEQVAESELFGHGVGAFTGAQRAHGGLFRAAAGGTLFLDELAELTAPVQAKLLRALATGEVRSVGETKASHVDARVVAATNVDLAKAVEAGSFRGDLYSRLMGFRIHVPPLRARRSDVLLLGTALAGITPDAIAPDAAEALVLHDWPYNVRELAQTVRAASQLARGRIELGHLPTEIAAHVHDRASAGAPRRMETLPPTLLVRRDRAPSADELREVLKHFGGNVAKVAAFFDKDRRQIYRWAEKLGVDLTEER